MRAAVFLDRDGVVIENRLDHVKSWNEVAFLDGTWEALRRLAASPFAIVMVSNQGVVGRGVIGEDVAWDIQRRVVAEIETHGGRIDASYLCPHHPDAGCTCRKPAPGMLLRAAGDLELDLRQSWLIGDALTDIEAAAAVGARGILVRTGRGASQASLLIPRDGLQYTVVDDLAEAAARIAEDQPAFCDSGFRGPST